MTYHSTGYAIVLCLVAANCTVRNPVYGKCTANEPLRCDDDMLVSCNDKGTAEVGQECPLGCSSASPQCVDPVPSNGLATYFQMASTQLELNLGDSATIDTDTGAVTANGIAVTVQNDAMVQTGAPTIRVFIVRALSAGNVIVTGKNALAVVSSGDIEIDGTFSVSATELIPGPGGFNEDACKGMAREGDAAGDGGGGFGSAGGKGGDGPMNHVGGGGGAQTGNLLLIPLRGGCDGGGVAPDRAAGAGGGALQLVSGTDITVSGVIAANGSGGKGGGGSGGGILLEAPSIEVSGSVVANGGGGGGCKLGEDGQLDAMPAKGGIPCVQLVNTGIGSPIFVKAGAGGDGAAAGSEAKAGDSVTGPGSGGSGGGGIGRIRINTGPDGLSTTGTFSPDPSLGTLATP